MTTDRHGITVLDVHECWDLLRQTEVGRLAVSIHDETEVFPINFVVDRGTVVFRTAQGTKLVGAIEGRTVAFEADGYEPGGRGGLECHHQGAGHRDRAKPRPL